jgi:hypothetical protein
MTLATAHVFARHGRQHGGRALHRRALQVVGDGAQATQLFAAAGAARAAVLEQRQRRAVAGGLGRRFAIQHVQAAVQQASAGTMRAPRFRGLLVTRRAHQAALAARGQGAGLRRPPSYGISVLTGPKASTSCTALVGQRVARTAAAWARRRRHSPCPRPPARQSPRRRRRPVPRLAQQGHALGHVGLLRVRGQGAHLHALHRRVTHHHLGQARAQGARPPRPGAARHDGAADGGALLAGLDRHLARHLLHEQVELFVVGRDTRAPGWRSSANRPRR